MTRPHKHAAVLVAISEGKEVQFKTRCDKLWFINPSSINPISHPEFDWRIKPPQWQDDLRKAAEKGKEVQYRCLKTPDVWNRSLLNDIPDLYDFEDAIPEQYRLKPEPKPDVVKRALVRQKSVDWHDFTWSLDSQAANVSFLFDGETNELKSVSKL